jgi:hypothetical protein
VHEGDDVTFIVEVIVFVIVIGALDARLITWPSPRAGG